MPMQTDVPGYNLPHIPQATLLLTHSACVLSIPLHFYFVLPSFKEASPNFCLCMFIPSNKDSYTF